MEKIIEKYLLKWKIVEKITIRIKLDKDVFRDLMKNNTQLKRTIDAPTRQYFFQSNKYPFTGIINQEDFKIRILGSGHYSLISARMIQEKDQLKLETSFNAYTKNFFRSLIIMFSMLCLFVIFISVAVKAFISFIIVQMACMLIIFIAINILVMRHNTSTAKTQFCHLLNSMIDEHIKSKSTLLHDVL